MLYSRKSLVLASLLAAACLSVGTMAQAADPCQTAIIKSLAKYKKVYLKSHAKCLDKENKLQIAADSCPDALADLAVGKANNQVKAKIEANCTLAQIQALGFRSDCAYEAATEGVEAQCAALPVTSTDEFAKCMECWKEAELSEFIAILYASHALEECEDDLGETSTRCSNLECTSPLPVQHVLGDTAENDCQRAIGKAGVNYLIKREKILEKCLLKGCTQAQCLGGTCEDSLATPVQLGKVEAKKATVIKDKCGNRDPSPDLPSFCCRCGTGNQCMNITDRATCEATTGCTVQDGKVCNTTTLTCDQGPRTITWWNNCPESTTGSCPGASVTTLEGLIACVDTSADTIVDELLCLQFPGYPCPPEDQPTTTTTTTTSTTLLP